MRAALLHLIGILCIVAASRFAACQDLPPLVAAHPLNLFHARPQGLELSWPSEPGWKLSTTGTYANSFTVSDLAAAVHLDGDEAGAPFSPSSAQRVIDEWPEGTELLLDTEILVANLEAARRLGNGLVVGLRIPWWRVGGTGLDPLPSAWHRFWGVGDGGRDLFPYGDTVVFLSHDHSHVSSRSAPGSGLGNLGLWLGRELVVGPRVRHRLWLSLAAPTADNSILGEQGWDLGLRWSMSVALGRGLLHAGAGWTAIGGSTPTTDAADTWHLWVGYATGMERGIGLAVMARADSSAYRGHATGDQAEATAELAIGPTFRLGSSTQLQIALGEDFPGAGLTPDFSLQVRLLWTPKEPQTTR